MEQMAEEEEMSQEEDQIKEESTKGESSSTVVLNQSVATMGCSGIDTSDDKVEVEGLSVTAFPTRKDEDKEDPQDEENQHMIGGD